MWTGFGDGGMGAFDMYVLEMITWLARFHGLHDTKKARQQCVMHTQ